MVCMAFDKLSMSGVGISDMLPIPAHAELVEAPAKIR